MTQQTPLPTRDADACIGNSNTYVELFAAPKWDAARMEMRMELVMFLTAWSFRAGRHLTEEIRRVSLEWEYADDEAENLEADAEQRLEALGGRYWKHLGVGFADAVKAVKERAGHAAGE